jgi:hypothetical protein
MQDLCNQSVTRKMSSSVGRVAGVMINAAVAILRIMQAFLRYLLFPASAPSTSQPTATSPMPRMTRRSLLPSCGRLRMSAAG